MFICIVSDLLLIVVHQLKYLFKYNSLLITDKIRTKSVSFGSGVESTNKEKLKLKKKQQKTKQFM